MEAVITGHFNSPSVLLRRECLTPAVTSIHCPPAFGPTHSLRCSSPKSLGAEVSSHMRGGPVARSAGADNITDSEKEGWATRQVSRLDFLFLSLHGSAKIYITSFISHAVCQIKFKLISQHDNSKLST